MTSGFRCSKCDRPVSTGTAAQNRAELPRAVQNLHCLRPQQPPHLLGLLACAAPLASRLAAACTQAGGQAVSREAQLCTRSAGRHNGALTRRAAPCHAITLASDGTRSHTRRGAAAWARALSQPVRQASSGSHLRCSTARSSRFLAARSLSSRRVRRAMRRRTSGASTCRGRSSSGLGERG